VLEFLHRRGLPLARDWRDNGVVKAASVAGPIPAADVLEHFGRPGAHVAAVNCLEVGSERIRILGPEFEEYLIISDTSGSLCTPPA
jgi:hypothetical protein